MDGGELFLLAGAAAVSATALVIVAWSLYLHFLIVVPPNRALVIFGRGNRSREERDVFGRSARVDRARYLVGGRAFVPPWTQGYGTLSLSTIDVDVPVHGVRPAGGVSASAVDLRVGLQVKISSDPEGLRSAAENLLGRGEAEIRGIVRSVVEGHVPSVVAQCAPERLEIELERMAMEIQILCATDLVPLGLVVQSLSVKELTHAPLPPPPTEGPAARGSPLSIKESDLDRLVWELSSRLRKLEQKLDEVERRTRTPEIHPLVPDLEGLAPRVTVSRS